MASRLSRASEFDIGRHELRDGSGLMWLERNTGERFQVGRAATEVEAGLTRPPRLTPPPAQAPPSRRPSRQRRSVAHGPKATSIPSCTFVETTFALDEIAKRFGPDP